jgi:hypothetical protein
MPLVYIPKNARERYMQLRLEADMVLGQPASGIYSRCRDFTDGLEAAGLDITGWLIMDYDWMVMDAGDVCAPWAWLIWSGPLITSEAPE